jgi:hypothetical protein
MHPFDSLLAFPSIHQFPSMRSIEALEAIDGMLEYVIIDAFRGIGRKYGFDDLRVIQILGVIHERLDLQGFRLLSAIGKNEFIEILRGIEGKPEKRGVKT